MATKSKQSKVKVGSGKPGKDKTLSSHNFSSKRVMAFIVAVCVGLVGAYYIFAAHADDIDAQNNLTFVIQCAPADGSPGNTTWSVVQADYKCATDISLNQYDAHATYKVIWNATVTAPSGVNAAPSPTSAAVTMDGNGIMPGGSAPGARIPFELVVTPGSACVRVSFSAIVQGRHEAYSDTRGGLETSSGVAGTYTWHTQIPNLGFNCGTENPADENGRAPTKAVFTGYPSYAADPTPTNPGQGDGSGSGNGGDGTGKSGKGSGGGGNGGSTATKQSVKNSTVPSASAQGTSTQTKLEPSPFYDGKQYASGSDQDTGSGIVAKSRRSLVSHWYYSVAGLALVIVVVIYVTRQLRRRRGL